jgi:hypothetical protein
LPTAEQKRIGDGIWRWVIDRANGFKRWNSRRVRYMIWDMVGINNTQTWDYDPGSYDKGSQNKNTKEHRDHGHASTEPG